MVINLKTKAKISGIFQIIVGILLLCYVLPEIPSRFQFLSYPGSQLKLREIIQIMIIQEHVEILISFGFLISGVFLILNKKIGWITSIALSAIIALAILLLLFLNRDNDLVYISTTDYVLYIFIASPFIANTLVLISKQFRNEFHPTNEIWIGILIFVILILWDFFVLPLIAATHGNWL